MQENIELKTHILEDLTLAMKAQDKLTMSTLRMIKSEIMKHEVSGPNKVATNDVVIDLLKRGVKQRKEASEGFKKGGKDDMAQKELDEIKVIERYLPEQMSEDQVREIVKSTIDEMSAGASDFGKVMGAAMAKTKGQADGNVVSKLVKEMLG